jgi:hypothetical protein
MYIDCGNASVNVLWQEQPEISAGRSSKVDPPCIPAIFASVMGEMGNGKKYLAFPSSNKLSIFSHLQQYFSAVSISN